VELDTSRWSGDGAFTQVIIDRLRDEPRIADLRIEDAPASREDSSYTFISNELFVRPTFGWRHESGRRWGLWPRNRQIPVPALTMGEVEQWLAADETIGAPDFADGGMLQYLRTQRIIPPYQARGYKLIELVRLYLVGVEPSR
jgi:hypothetical protein